jgi:hypothetical protein
VKKLLLLSAVFVMFISLSSNLYAWDMEAGVPIAALFSPTGENPSGIAYILLKTPAADKSGRCGQGTWFPGLMQLDTTTTIGKQMLAMVLSASTANMPITLGYTYTEATNSCVVDVIIFPNVLP